MIISLFKNNILKCKHKNMVNNVVIDSFDYNKYFNSKFNQIVKIQFLCRVILLHCPSENKNN